MHLFFQDSPLHQSIKFFSIFVYLWSVEGVIAYVGLTNLEQGNIALVKCLSLNQVPIKSSVWSMCKAHLLFFCALDPARSLPLPLPSPLPRSSFSVPPAFPREPAALANWQTSVTHRKPTQHTDQNDKPSYPYPKALSPSLYRPRTFVPDRGLLRLEGAGSDGFVPTSSRGQVHCGRGIGCQLERFVFVFGLGERFWGEMGRMKGAARAAMGCLNDRWIDCAREVMCREGRCTTGKG